MLRETKAAAEPGQEGNIAIHLAQLRKKTHTFHAQFRGFKIMLESKPESSTYIRNQNTTDGVAIAFGSAAEMRWTNYFVITPKRLYLMDNVRRDALASAPTPNTFAAAIASGLKLLDKYIHSRVFGTLFDKDTRVYLGKFGVEGVFLSGVRVGTETFRFTIKSPDQPNTQVQLTAKEVLDTFWTSGEDQFFPALKRLVRDRMATSEHAEAAAEPDTKHRHHLKLFIWVRTDAETRTGVYTELRQHIHSIRNLLAARRIQIQDFGLTTYAIPKAVLVYVNLTLQDPKPDLTLLVSLLAKQDWVVGFSNNMDADDSFIEKDRVNVIRNMIADLLSDGIVEAAAEPETLSTWKPVGTLRITINLKTLPTSNSEERKLWMARLQRRMSIGLVDCSWHYLKFHLFVNAKTTAQDIVLFSHSIASVFSDLPQHDVVIAVQNAYKAGVRNRTLAGAVMSGTVLGKYEIAADEAKAAAEPTVLEKSFSWYRIPANFRYGPRVDALEKALRRAGYAINVNRRISPRGLKTHDLYLDVRVPVQTEGDAHRHVKRIATIVNTLLKPKVKVVPDPEDVPMLMDRAFHVQAAAEPPSTLLHIPDIHFLTDLDPDTSKSLLQKVCDEFSELLERYGFQGDDIEINLVDLSATEENWCVTCENLTFTGAPAQLLLKFKELLQHLNKHPEMHVDIKTKYLAAYVKDMHESMRQTTKSDRETVTVGSTATPDKQLLCIGTRTQASKAEPMTRATAAAEKAPSIKEISFRMLLSPSTHASTVKFVEGLLEKYKIKYSSLKPKEGDVFGCDDRDEDEAATDVTTFILHDVQVPGPEAAQGFTKELYDHWQYQGTEHDTWALRNGLLKNYVVHAAAEPQPQEDEPVAKPGQPVPYVHAVDGKIRGLLQLLTKWTAAEKNAVGKESLRKLLVLCKQEAWPRLAEESKKKLLDLK